MLYSLNKVVFPRAIFQRLILIDKIARWLAHFPFFENPPTILEVLYTSTSPNVLYNLVFGVAKEPTKAHFPEVALSLLDRRSQEHADCQIMRYSAQQETLVYKHSFSLALNCSLELICNVLRRVGKLLLSALENTYLYQCKPTLDEIDNWADGVVYLHKVEQTVTGPESDKPFVNHS